ncbi:integral membrane protein [Bordetella pertussis]|uniref:Integral membrane protein n=22 Tax=Bordetella pertussis TaxID=520 RepID=Q7VUW1_BORPE|nr:MULTISPECIES: DUF6776 family protein [Bordetella]ETH40146.1 hypothetical protein L547_3465 [Bordetella pertussis H918]ETH43397.1 hypothetical protein L549_1362 [Bordetella pertussis H939]ETH47808.1 hypothetical protein L548_3698 [Bordetella pertussis H921]ETH72043.1 hypothetical protein L545_3499 [Bordetella pertussis STO1-CHLA-0011]ETH88323.1 hypothetical protein L560_3564 [Bordetella pertussis STO1-CHOC-0018]ETH91190.1 hypothetical protein L561_3611 [Bordetella pertussis STO1-CHOC-0019]
MPDDSASVQPRAPVARPQGRARAWLALAAGLVVGAVAGWRYGLAHQGPDDAVVLTRQQVAAQEAAMQQREAEARFLRAQLDTADGEIAVERAARTELETQLQSAQSEVGRVRDQLAFYEQLLPPGPAGSVDIRGVAFEREGQGLRYKVLLMRSGRGETPFSGALRFQATGTLKGETVTRDLEPLTVKAEGGGATVPEAGASLLALQFDQYQRSQGLLDLPDGFVPETVTVSVLEDTTVRATRTVKLEF